MLQKISGTYGEFMKLNDFQMITKGFKSFPEV